MGLNFSQEWVAERLADFFQKPVYDITAEDMASIKYLCMGETFGNEFMLYVSSEMPPDPFVDCDGGDEWLFCLRGDDISKLAEKFKDRENEQLYMFGLDHEDEEWEELISSDEAEAKWASFSKSVIGSSYYEQPGDDEFDKWYDGICESTWRDVMLFTGVEVLRIQGLDFPDLGFLDVMPNLRVLELVETRFASMRGIEKLTRLKQLACWLN